MTITHCNTGFIAQVAQLHPAGQAALFIAMAIVIAVFLFIIMVKL